MSKEHDNHFVDSVIREEVGTFCQGRYVGTPKSTRPFGHPVELGNVAGVEFAPLAGREPAPRVAGEGERNPPY